MTDKLSLTYLDEPTQEPTQARQKTNFEDKYHEVFAELRRIISDEHYTYEQFVHAVCDLSETEVK